MSRGNRGQFWTSFPLVSVVCSFPPVNQHQLAPPRIGSRRRLKTLPSPCSCFCLVPAPVLDSTESRPRGGQPYSVRAAPPSLGPSRARLGLDRRGRLGSTGTGHPAFRRLLGPLR